MKLTKFSLDEVWLDREDNPFLIIGINRNESWPIKAKSLIDDTLVSYSPLGYDVGEGIESNLDLVRFIGNKINFPEYFL